MKEDMTMEEESDNRACPDCEAKPGELHDDGCHVAWCAVTGRPRLIRCQSYEEMRHVAGTDCRMVWTGELPGTTECREYGFFAYPRWEVGEGDGWAPCDESHPKAMPDLTRLLVECVWSQEKQRYVKR